jgi:hypothetical protein
MSEQRCYALFILPFLWGLGIKQITKYKKGIAKAITKGDFKWKII